MTSFILFNLQTALSLIVFSLIAAWHIAPRLSKLKLEEALIPLLWVHAFRYIPMALLAPGQIDPGISKGAVSAIAYGDLLASVLAIISMVLLIRRVPWALAFVWLFNIVGVLDVINALFQGISNQLYLYPLGFGWYVLNFYVPMVIVTHVLMIRKLLANRRSV